VLQGRLVAGRAQSPTKFFMPLSTSAAATADRLFAACGFVLLTLLAWAILRHQDLIDDAYITARYADNLAHGYGWAWNPGAAPTDGTTAPLWTLLLAGVSLSLLPFVPATLALDAVFYGLLGLCGYLLVGKLAGRVAAAIFLAITAAFAVLLPSCAGMETPLYGALLMASFLAWHCDRRRAAFALAGLLPLVRGDGLLVWGILCVAMLLERRARELWPAALAALLPLACWELFSLWQFHSLLPTSFLAKHAQSAIISGKITWRSFLRPGWPAQAAVWLLLSAALGTLAGLRALATRMLTLWLILYVTFYVGVANVPNQPWYVVPVWWVLPVLIAVALGQARRIDGKLAPRRLILPALCATFAVLGLRPAPAVAQAALAYHASPPNLFYQAAGYLNTHPRGLVAAAEIGALGYYSGDPIVDVLGLVSPEVVPHLRMRDYSWVITAERPRYVLLWASISPVTSPCWGDLTCIVWHTPYFRRHYRVVRWWGPHTNGSYTLLAYH